MHRCRYVERKFFTVLCATCCNHLYSLELLMMGIIVPEICWACYKFNNPLGSISWTSWIFTLHIEKSVVREFSLSSRSPRCNTVISPHYIKLVQAHTNSSFTRVINLSRFRFNTTFLDPLFTLTPVLTELLHTIDALCCLVCFRRGFPYQAHFLPVLFVSWLIFLFF